jgi:DNA mismatch endonuclease (patch repair protein)
MRGIDPKRSALMARVGGKDTKPEMTVRRIVHAMGYRYRLHRRGLPGTPDLVFGSQSKIIFVHGCFWHRHARCPRTTTPKTRTKFWQSKFDANVNRDVRNIKALHSTGWKVLVVWECEANDLSAVRRRLKSFLKKTV